MIVVDIEVPGLFPEEHGIYQIGAIDLNNPNNTFLEEARIDEEDKVLENALTIIGKTEEEVRDSNKQSQKQLLQNFFKWTSKIEDRTLISYNASFDYGFLTLKARKYGLECPIHYRTFDLHVIAAMKYLEINKEFPIEGGKSIMHLPKTIEMCGMKDERIQLKDGKVIQEGKPHNALEDAKLEAECFSRLIYGKNLLPEYKKFPIPKNLKQ